jgi:hypothetical protein
MKKTVTVLAITFISFVNLFAQEKAINKDHDGGLEAYASFAFGYPIKGMDHYDYSIGGYSHFDYNFNKKLAARVDIGWNEFYGPDIIYTDTDGNTHTDVIDMSVWEFTAGARYRISIFYVEGRAGYFTGVHSWGGVPAIGVKYRKFDFQANMIITSDMQWGGVRIGYFF